jgi:predicted phage tail protein
MSNRPISAIPEPPKSADPALRAFMSAVKEAIEVRLGRRGDPLDEAITKRELVESGIARLRTARQTDLAPVTVEPSEARIVPPAPIGFYADGVFGGVHLTWENPFQAYRVHAYTEVWRGQSNDRAAAVLINSSRGTTFYDRIPDDDAGDYWYWIRFVSEYNREGPFSLPFKAGKPMDTAKLLEQLSGAIDESALTESFRQEVGMLQSSYTIKLEVNGYASGFTTYNDGKRADFAVLADRFWVGSPIAGRIKPFIVEDGTVYMDTAVIREASIQQGKLGPIGFGKIVGADGKPVTTLAGKLRADAIDVESLQVTDANIAGVLKSNAVASNGQPRWMLDKNGGMTLNGSGKGGRMEIRDTVIKVFDDVGRLRVQLGDLTL